MPRWLVRLLAVLAGCALIACFFGMLAALSLGVSQEAPLPQEAARVLLVFAGFGAVVCGVLLWGLNHNSDESAHSEGRSSGQR